MALVQRYLDVKMRSCASWGTVCSLQWVSNTTFTNILVIQWPSVLSTQEAGRTGENIPYISSHQERYPLSGIK